ncbi:MAG: SRPBCC family protein, partial [Chloroflexota bacterium]
MQRAERSIRVAAPVEQVYRFWRNFENFPQFMEHVEEVRLLDPQGQTSHWKLKGAMGMTPEFDARLTQDEPNR